MDAALAITVDLCKHFEGFYAKPYLCPASVLTIGYGATFYEDGRRIQLTDPPVTKERAEELLLFELRKIVFPGVIRLCPSLLTEPPARLAAIADFTFNLGTGRLQTSTLRRRVNAGQWEEAKEQLMRWTRGGGRVLPGLVRRRKAESDLL